MKKRPNTPKSQIRSSKDRFDSMVYQDPNSGCWIWTGALGGGEYGVFWYERKQIPAHKWIYEHMRGRVNSSKQLDHLCRVRCCVNPNHLEEVTCRENLMRGNTLAAMNYKKTHCIRGHELSGDNLYTYPDGKRQCRKCYRVAEQRFLDRKRNASQQ
jgi:hypothetical protein